MYYFYRGMSEELQASTAEEIHRHNIYRLGQQEEINAINRHVNNRPIQGKKLAEIFAQFGPRGPLQISHPILKGLEAKRTLRRTEVLYAHHAKSEEKSQPIESCLANCPIKIDLEIDGFKLRDSILWSLNDHTVSMETVATITCEDFELPTSTFVPAIVKTITDQIIEYQEFLGMLRMMGGLKEFQGIRGLIRVITSLYFILPL